MESNKRREKIKTVAIVFLTVLLILTFFSNTIMNYSLPEVSAQYTSSGVISSKVRGTGTVEAVEPYEVRLSEARKVEEVLVKEGDEVKKGQVLFRLGKGAESDGNALEEAEDALDQARLEYRQKLYGEVSDDALADLNVRNAREDLDKALERQDLAGNKEERAEKLSDSLKEARRKQASAQAEVDQMTADIAAMDTAAGDVSFYEAEVAAAEAAVADWEARQSRMQTEIKKQEHARDDAQTDLDEAKADLEEWELVANPPEDQEVLPPVGEENADPYEKIETLRKRIHSLENTIRSYGDAISALETSQLDIEAGLNEANQRKAGADRDLKAAQQAASEAGREKKEEMEEELRLLTAKLSDATAEAEELEAEQAELAQDATTPEQAEEAVTTAERAYANAVIEYEKSRREAAGQQAVGELELEILQKKIKRLEKKVKKLQKGGGEDPNEVKAQVAGVISSVSVVAGEDTVPETPLAVIQILEKGFLTSFAVTLEQSRIVKPGDKAAVLNVWDTELDVTLSRVEADPANPSASRILYFDVNGDAEIGQSLDMSVGERSASYDVIVPNSAVHEDSNGKFVLSVTVKSSPLGNRYIATRESVDVLASDDTNSAISGDLSGGDFIITTSTKPLEPGDQVRLVEGGDVW